MKYPKVSFDGSKMIFVANYYGVFRSFTSDYNYDSLKWGKPAPILKDVIEGYEIRDPQYNFDHTKVYFSAKTNEKPDYDIYYSEKVDGVWSTLKAIPIDINTGVDELGNFR